MKQTVILLHGMGRTGFSMWFLGRSLKRAGYHVVNLGYPSTRKSIGWIVEEILVPEIARLGNRQSIHFVTHSLGGIVVRQYLQNHSLPEGSRVVMLAPPNRGSEVADRLMNWKPYQWLNGPAGQQLGTSKESVPNRLKPVKAQIGVITGNRSTNPLFSNWIEGDDDGKVGVNSAQLNEMADFMILPVTHTFIMNNQRVIRQVLYFIKNGQFDHDQFLDKK
ncbi:MAG: alpha/beta fold hydrolase [Gammaproteobacteria bacterium]|nr:MAG: alpha/beta fold hydrolase [Gammaproteobacteria bacterium]